MPHDLLLTTEIDILVLLLVACLAAIAIAYGCQQVALRLKNLIADSGISETAMPIV